MIIKSLLRRRTRTLLTILGVAVGVAAVLSMSAFGEGFASGFASISSSTEADLMVGQKEAVLLMLSAVDDEVGDQIRNIAGVKDVAGTVVGIVQMPDSPYFVVMGEDPKSFNMAHYRLIEGEMITSRRQIMLGKNTATNFNKTIGDPFRINEGTYRVVGIYETGVAMEDGGAVMGLEDARRAFNRRNQVNYFSVKVKEPGRINEVRAKIEEQFEDLAVSRSGEPTQQDQTLDLYRSFGWFVGIFAILVGGLGMMNTTLMSVFERTREIGVLRAMGWSKWRVIWMILGESLILSLLGGIVGIGMGVGLTELAQMVPAVQALLSGVFSVKMFQQALAIALLLGALGGIYPAWRAAQLQPVDAMRYESGATTGDKLRIPWLARLFSGGSLRNIWRRPTRTLITVAGIGIGVGFIVALVAMTDGFIVTFNQFANAGRADLLAEEANSSDVSFSKIDERIAIRVLGEPEVESVSRVIIGISATPGLAYFMVFGVDPGEEYINHYQMSEGSFISRPHEIMIGRFAATGLKKGVGDKIHLGGTSYTIVGIYETGSAFEDASGTISLKDAQELLDKPHNVTLLGIRLKEEYRGQTDEVAEKLEAEYPELFVSRSTEFAQNVQDMATTYAVLNALIVLTIIVGGIVMMNAMLMSVFERTQEIGVLRALGWRRRQVIWMVMVESMAVSCLSAVVGMGIGVGLNYLFTLEPSLGGFLSPSYSPRIFIEVFILAVILGTIGGIYPAWRAAGLRPVDALRYE